jgi:hypothetical protein
MKLFELNEKLIKKFEGLEWSTWRCGTNTASAYEISNAIKELVPEKYRQYITYHSNNRHIVIFFEGWVAYKWFRHRVLDMDVRTKQDKTYTGYGTKFTVDHFDYDLMTKQYEEYKGESDDIDALLDFVFELAKKDAVEFNKYRVSAIAGFKALSEAVGTKDWTELANMINYIKANFGRLYEDAGLKKTE